jgi:hypothetical protein
MIDREMKLWEGWGNVGKRKTEKKKAQSHS